MADIFNNFSVIVENATISKEGLIADNDFLKPVFTQELIDAYQAYRFERDVWPDEGRPTAFEFKTTYQC